MTNLSLAEKVEGLTCSCRETDIRVWAAVNGWSVAVHQDAMNVECFGLAGWFDQGGSFTISQSADHIARYTASLDAVVALIEKELPGARLQVSVGSDYSSARIVSGWGARKRVLAPPIERADHHVAICAVAAFLRAKGEQNG